MERFSWSSGTSCAWSSANVSVPVLFVCVCAARVCVRATGYLKGDSPVVASVSWVDLVASSLSLGRELKSAGSEVQSRTLANLRYCQDPACFLPGCLTFKAFHLSYLEVN